MNSDLDQKFKRAMEVEDHGFTPSLLKKLPPKKKKKLIPSESLLWLGVAGILLGICILSPDQNFRTFWSVGTCMAMLMSGVTADWSVLEEVWAYFF